MNSDPSPENQGKGATQESDSPGASNPVGAKVVTGSKLPFAQILTLFSLLLLIVGLYRAATSIHRSWNTPEIPVPNLAGVDPEIIQAIEVGRGRVSKSPSSANAWGFMGRVFRAHEFGAEAEFCFRHAEKLNPLDPRWPYLLARGLPGQKTQEAIDCLERSVRAGGPVSAPRLMLAELLLSSGRLDDSEKHLKAVIEAEPSNARALLGLARVEIGRNHTDAALPLLQESKKLAPEIKMTRSLIAQSYQRLGRSNEAEQESKEASGLGEEFDWPDPYQDEVTALWVGQKSQLTLGITLWRKGRTNDAIQVIRLMAAKYPDSAKAQFLLGEKLNILGDWSEAEPALRSAIRIMPEFSRSYFELAYNFHQQGQLENAREYYLKAIERQPNYAVAHYNLSLCLTSLGDRTKAREAVQTAIRYQPNVAKAHRHLGKLLLQEGRFQEARASLLNATKLDPSDQASAELLRSIP